MSFNFFIFQTIYVPLSSSRAQTILLFIPWIHLHTFSLIKFLRFFPSFENNRLYLSLRFFSLPSLHHYNIKKSNFWRLISDSINFDLLSNIAYHIQYIKLSIFRNKIAEYLVSILSDSTMYLVLDLHFFLIIKFLYSWLYSLSNTYTFISTFHLFVILVSIRCSCN